MYENRTVIVDETVLRREKGMKEVVNLTKVHFKHI
jgi:hypothetical protein